jgi:hypothetical protein
MQVLLKIDSLTSTSSAKKRRNLFLFVREGSQEVESTAAVVEEYDMGVLGQECGQNILVRKVVGFDEARVRPSLDACTVEVERYYVILEN